MAQGIFIPLSDFSESLDFADQRPKDEGVHAEDRSSNDVREFVQHGHWQYSCFDFGYQQN